MKSRLFKSIALAGVVLATVNHAQVCEETILYNGNNTPGHMEQAGATFPEFPEWNANWGDFENMKSPYIRLSGQNSETADWKGALVFNAMPVKVNGGTLSLKARATQNVKFGVWIEGDFGTGQVHFADLAANKTSSLKISVTELAAGSKLELQKIWIGLFNVKGYQYTTLFVDDIVLSCTQRGAPSGTKATFTIQDSKENNYPFADVDPSSTVRADLWGDEPIPATSAHYDVQKRAAWQAQTTSSFVLSEGEHRQISRFLKSDSLSPKESRDGWYKSLYLVDRNRIRDSVIANPKQLYLDAGSTAAAYEMKTIPLLVASLDYSYATCQDTLCNSTKLNDYHLLVAGIPTSYTGTSKVTFVYDPSFVISTSGKMPETEICTSAKCEVLAPMNQVNLEFPSAGVQQIRIKLNDGVTVSQQKFSLEVK